MFSLSTKWVISYDNFSWLLELDSNTFSKNKEFLDEDLLQIMSLDDMYCIDVGWYPSLDPKGYFKILLIQNQDWSSPIQKYMTKNLQEVVSIINNLLNSTY